MQGDGDRHLQRSPPRAQKILIVEDDQQIRELLSAALRRAGYRVATAEDGEGGWEAFEESRSRGSDIDLLVADVVMPRLGGVELADRIRQASPDTQVLFMSGYRDRDTPADAVLLSKPFSYETLVGEIREALNGPAPLA